jgi:hypothetical protein
VSALAETAAREANVPAWLILAIAQHESGGFYPDARRGEAHLSDSSHGLMQILLGTARSTGFNGEAGSWNNVTRTGTGLYDPLTNLRAGAKHLRQLLNATSGDVERTVSAYNAGLGNARKATSPTRFCLLWKPTAPRIGRSLDRDCANIVVVQTGQWMNQGYVDAIHRIALTYGGKVKGPTVVPVPLDSVGSGVVSRPAGGLPSGAAPSPSSSEPVFVVRTALVVVMAAVSAIAYLALRK